MDRVTMLYPNKDQRAVIAIQHKYDSNKQWIVIQTKSNKILLQENVLGKPSVQSHADTPIASIS